MKLIAKIPVLYFAHLYSIGDELPVADPVMVAAWLAAGSAVWREDGHIAEQPVKKPKAKKATVQPGQIGISTTGKEEDLVGRIPQTPGRKRR